MLVGFRKKRIAFGGDIREMYHQMFIISKDKSMVPLPQWQQRVSESLRDVRRHVWLYVFAGVSAIHQESERGGIRGRASQVRDSQLGVQLGGVRKQIVGTGSVPTGQVIVRWACSENILGRRVRYVIRFPNAPCGTIFLSRQVAIEADRFKLCGGTFRSTGSASAVWNSWHGHHQKMQQNI